MKRILFLLLFLLVIQSVNAQEYQHTLSLKTNYLFRPASVNGFMPLVKLLHNGELAYRIKNNKNIAEFYILGGQIEGGDFFTIEDIDKLSFTLAYISIGMNYFKNIYDEDGLSIDYFIGPSLLSYYDEYLANIYYYPDWEHPITVDKFGIRLGGMTGFNLDYHLSDRFFINSKLTYGLYPTAFRLDRHFITLGLGFGVHLNKISKN